MENEETLNQETDTNSNGIVGIDDKQSKEGTEKSDDDGWKRNEDGTFGEGNKGGGRLPDTEEEKIKKQALKELKESYINRLTEALPKIDPVLIEKGIQGDLIAIKEINDRVLGKPRQVVGIGGEKEGEAIIIKKIDYAGNNNTTSIPAEELPITISTSIP